MLNARTAITRLAVPLAVTALLLAGCGGNDGDDSAKATSKKTTSTTTGAPPTQPTLPKDSKGSTTTTPTDVPLPPAPDSKLDPNKTSGADASAPSDAVIDVATPKVLDVVTTSAHFSGTVQRRYSALRVAFFDGKTKVLGRDLATTCPAGSSPTARCTFDTTIALGGVVPAGNYTVDVGYSATKDDTKLAPVIPLPLTVHDS